MKVSPFSFTYPPQSAHKISNSALQCVRLNASITGHESRKQFAIGLTVEQISQLYRKAASANNKRNTTKFNQKQNIFTERQEPNKIESVWSQVRNSKPRASKNKPRASYSEHKRKPRATGSKNRKPRANSEHKQHASYSKHKQQANSHSQAQPQAKGKPRASQCKPQH